MSQRDKSSSLQQQAELVHEIGKDIIQGKVALDDPLYPWKDKEIMKDRMTAIAEVAQRDPNKLDTKCWASIGGQYLLSPIYGGMGRVLIKQDEFKSRFDCTECGGKGHTDEVCQYCLGTKFQRGKEENGECPDCTVGTSDGRITFGRTLCPSCKGKQGTIIIPDDAKSDTTMGIVIAVSATDINIVRPGDKVMYSSYYGTKFEFVGNVLRIGTEKDLFCLVKQLKQNVDSVKEQGFADLENSGVPHD